MAPSDSAASSSPCPFLHQRDQFARDEGKVTNIVASTIPGMAKMMRDAMRHEPRPEPGLGAEEQHEKARDDRRTEKGRSINVISGVLKRNVNLAIAQAAATPKTALNGTAIAAISSVRRMAGQASGSAKLATDGARPLGQGLRKDVIGGANNSTASTATTSAISTQRGQGLSVAAGRKVRGGKGLRNVRHCQSSGGSRLAAR